MATFLQAYLGPGLVLVFCLSQALRDVYFGHVFQGVDFFAVILIAFLLSTVLFAVVAWRRTPGDFRKLRGQLGTVIAINLTTALAWSCSFFGLSQVEPSIVNTLHSGMAPLPLLLWPPSAAALPSRGDRLVRILRLCRDGGIARGLCWVVLSGSSGLRSGHEASTARPCPAAGQRFLDHR